MELVFKCSYIYIIYFACKVPHNSFTNKPASTNRLLRLSIFLSSSYCSFTLSASCILKGFCGGKSLQKYFLLLYLLLFEQLSAEKLIIMSFIERWF